MMNFHPPAQGPLSIARKRNQEVTAKPNATRPAVSTNLDSALVLKQQQQTIDDNRSKSKGSVGGSLGAFLNAPVDMPHSDVSKKIVDAASPALCAAPSLLSEGPRRGSRHPGQQKESAQFWNDDRPVVRSMKPQLAVGVPSALAAPTAATGLGDLVDLVYRNHAEACRSYLDFKSV